MRIKPEFKIREIAGENVIIRQADGPLDITRLLSLNATAVWLYNTLKDKDFTVEDVTALLTGRFEVDPLTAAADAGKWVESLREAALIQA